MSLVLTSAAFAKDNPPKPNVVVFLVDDMGWMDCGVYGSKYYATPNIDRFASRSMRFTDAYAQPLCSPTRCSLLTGKYSARHGITSATGHLPPQRDGHQFLAETGSPSQPMLAPDSKNFMEPSEYTLAEALRDGGYRTAHIGKWHLGIERRHWPEQQGFDVAFHCHPDPGPPGNYFSPYGVSLEGQPQGKNKVGTIADGPAGEYIVDRLADEAVKFIAENKGRPFYLNLWNYGVHGLWGHKVEYTQAFVSKNDPRGAQGNPIMASMLRSVDECFGRIIEALEQHGIADNTIVVFNSDNGGNTHSNTADDAKTKGQKSAALADWRKWAGTQPPTNNSPLRDGKGTLYEGGTRVPLMWAWAGRIKPGTTSDAVVGHIDLYPTLLELLGLARPSQQKFDGVSYARVLRSEGSLERSAFFNYFPHGRSPGRAGGVWARSGDWKLIRWFGELTDDMRFELYSLRDDLGETTNLAAKQPEHVQKLNALIDGFLLETQAKYPRPNPTYKPGTTTANRPASTNVADPLEGWKARQCDAVVHAGRLLLTSKSQPGTAFLGHGSGKSKGPIDVKFRVRSPVAGDGKVEWLGDPAAGDKPRSVRFHVEGGDWQELSVNVPATGWLGTTRLYLPAADQPWEVDWIEFSGQGVSPKPMRWDFNRTNQP